MTTKQEECVYRQIQKLESPQREWLLDLAQTGMCDNVEEAVKIYRRICGSCMKS